MNETERDFFVTGVKTYIDACDAIGEFRKQVQEQCASVANERLLEINDACEMQWKSSGIGNYIYHFSPPSASESAQLGKKILVGNLGTDGGLYFYLMFPPPGRNLPYEALVNLYRGKRDVAVDLWAAVDSIAINALKTNNALIFKRTLPEDRLEYFGDYLKEAVDQFISFMRSVGGLKKHLGGA